jgi:predicted nucleic acid-binding protein
VNVVDSSGWLEFFANGPNAGFFASAIARTAELIVPTITLYEVFKKVLQQRGESRALQIVALLEQGTVVALNADLALSAAKLSATTKLPMADSIILATSRACDAVLCTQHAHLEGIEGVRYRAARR